jgi:hypothetical protein
MRGKSAVMPVPDSEANPVFSPATAPVEALFHAD